jgi:hypothetical protein
MIIKMIGKIFPGFWRLNMRGNKSRENIQITAPEIITLLRPTIQKLLEERISKFSNRSTNQTNPVK